jgi:hypothetical protein
MMAVGIPVRDLRQVLESVKAALENPQLATRLLELCERNEAAVERFREEQFTLQCMRDEHKRFLARQGQEQVEELRRARDDWSREESSRRERLEKDEDEAARRREWADKDRRAAAELRQRLVRRAHKLGESGPPPGADSGIEQQPHVA